MKHKLEKKDEGLKKKRIRKHIYLKDNKGIEGKDKIGMEKDADCRINVRLIR